jgi:hypothetical protein
MQKVDFNQNLKLKKKSILEDFFRIYLSTHLRQLYFKNFLSTLLHQFNPRSQISTLFRHKKVISSSVLRQFSHHQFLAISTRVENVKINLCPF